MKLYSLLMSDQECKCNCICHNPDSDEKFSDDVWCCSCDIIIRFPEETKKIDELNKHYKELDEFSKKCSLRLEQLNVQIKSHAASLDRVYEVINNDFVSVKERVDKIESNKLAKELDPQVWSFVSERLSKLESKTALLPEHIEKLYHMLNIEDRITASDVLNRLTNIEDKIGRLENRYDSFCKAQHPTLLQKRIEELEEWTRKDEDCIYDRLTKLEDRINKIMLPSELPPPRIDERLTELEECINRITDDDIREGKKPHKCPACNRKKKIQISNDYDIYYIWQLPVTKDAIGRCFVLCNICEGKGVLWG